MEYRKIDIYFVGGDKVEWFKKKNKNSVIITLKIKKEYTDIQTQVVCQYLLIYLSFFTNNIFVK